MTKLTGRPVNLSRVGVGEGGVISLVVVDQFTSVYLFTPRPGVMVMRNV